jgi:type II secretory pathway pseudopilin PulG
MNLPIRPHPGSQSRPGVTLVELLVVILCLAAAAAILLPVAADGDATQIRSAAELLVADLEYAQSQSISHADDPRLVVFDTTGNRYHIAPRSAPLVPVMDPVHRSGYVTNYGTGRAFALPRVRLGSYILGGDDRLGFGGVGQLDQSSPASVTLTAGTRSLTITLDAVTGEATVGQMQ